MDQPAFRPTPFARRLTTHMCEWRRRTDGSDHPLLPHWADGIHPDFRGEALKAVAEDDVRLHDYAAALRSSQAFALNLFVPWRRNTRSPLNARVTETVGAAITVERITFEWIPPGALLGEIDSDRPRADERATGVDVVLWGRDEDDQPVALLLEVKLSEGGFTPCGGRVSSANKRPDVCASAATFFDEPAACYLRRPLRKARDRRYWEIFARSRGSLRAAFPGARLDGPCPFADQNQQPMRNLALAHALVQEGIVRQAWFGLCPHDANPDVAAHWAGWRALLAPADRAPVLLASDVLAAGREAGWAGWAEWMAGRYALPAP